MTRTCNYDGVGVPKGECVLPLHPEAPVIKCPACPFRKPGDPTEPPPEPPRPGLLRRLRNWVADTQRWLSAGSPLVSLEVYQERATICRSGRGGKYDANRDTCLACGCPLHSTAFGDKLNRATSECPLGYWHATIEVPD